MNKIVSRVKREFRRPVYFLHIPKTAGTSLKVYLDSRYQDSRVLDHHLWNSYLPSLNKNQLKGIAKPMSNYDFIRGHFMWGARREMRRKPIVITMVRNPYDRVISFYKHIEDTLKQEGRTGVFFEGDDDSFKNMLKDHRAVHFENYQTKSLGLNLDVKKSEKKKYQGKWMDFKNSHSIDEFLWPKVKYEKMLKNAKKNIDKCEVVGIKEYFPESVALIAYVFAWPLPTKLPRYNVTENKPKKVAKGIQQKIQELNRLDYQVYKHAFNRFKEDYIDLVEEVLGQEYTWQQIEKNRVDIFKKLVKNWPFKEQSDAEEAA